MDLDRLVISICPARPGWDDGKLPRRATDSRPAPTGQTSQASGDTGAGRADEGPPIKATERDKSLGILLPIAVLSWGH